MDDTKTPRTPELSKQVVDALKDAKRLDAMSQEHAQTVGARIAEDVADASLARPIALLVTLAGAKATRLAKEFAASDSDLTEELADDDGPRNARDTAEAQLREKINELREVLTGHYGGQFLATVHLGSQMPRDAEQLRRYAERARDKVVGLAVDKLPPSRIEGAKIAPKKWAAPLATPLAALAQALDDVQTEAAQLVTARARRARCESAWSSHASRWEDLFDALLRYAAMDAEADRVPRPNTGGAAKAVDDPADPLVPPANDPTNPK